ncbi:tail fiber domain-containing protein [Daejeonella sp.]|jgi:hypothetical protein|uniref:tail fiber domain-containing protein n=1 Tax=Daejeonella sp. TaxID=2805397 RepID=UPI003783A598
MLKNYKFRGLLLFTVISLLSLSSTFAQVGIGTNSPAASAALEVTSNTNNKGILIPRITAAQKDAISNPAEGLMIYQTSAPAGFYYYTGIAWKLIMTQTDLDTKLSTVDAALSLNTKVDKVTGKDLSSNDYTTAEKTKLAAIIGSNTGDQDLSTYATTSQLANKANSSDVTTSLTTKVDKVTGKELSTNDYTTAEKAKLAAITGSNTGDQDLSALATTASVALKANTRDVTTSLASKVDQVTGKVLSSNDYSTAEKTKLAAIAGTNTGDQDISGIITNAVLIARIQTDLSNQNGAIAINTAKVGITTAQANEIAANTAKVGITTAQAADIVTNNAKVGYTEALVSANTNVAANTAKVGITTAQASEIAANTLKVGYTEALVSANTNVAANTAKVGITTAQANEIAANTLKVGYTEALVSANTNVAANTAKVGITIAQANEIVANTAKVGITTAQAADIITNNAKVGYTDALVINKAPLASPTFTGTVSGITSTMVGLGNVDNTSDAAKNAATATLTNKTLASPVINTPTGIVKGDVGLGNVDNSTDLLKPVSTATQTALNLKANIASPTFTGTVTGPTFVGALTGNATTAGTVTTAAQPNITSVGTLGNLTVTDPIVGSITGNAATATLSSTVTTNANLTGDVISSGSNVTTIDAGRVTNAMLAGSIDLTSKVIGILPSSNGGTGSSTINFVDLTNNQTAAGNKTFSGNTSVGGTLNASGDLAVNTNKFIVQASTGNTAISGTLGVTGAATVGGTLTAGNVTYPNTHNATAGQVLTTDGTGVASWAAAASSGVPYTGANAAVNLGGYDLRVNGLTVGVGSGSHPSNTAFGVMALINNHSTAYNNSAIGKFALINNVTGIDNTALGNWAGAMNYHGSNNTSIGSFAMQNSVGDGFNTAVGMQAMTNTTSGSNNTAIGYNSLLTNTLGSKNTALGSLANVVASSNATAIGYGATVSKNNTIQLGADGTNGTVAISNVKTSGTITAGAVTYPNFDGAAGQVLTANANGFLNWKWPGVTNVPDNTVIGLRALNTNTTGSSNTAIGYQAGNSNTSGTNNTFIGSGANGSSGDVSNVITLGNAAIETLRSAVNTITSLSDRRDKTDIITISEGLDFLKQLKPVSFTWNTRDKAKVGIKSAGFIAQDLLALQQKSTIGANLDLVSQQNPDKFEARYSNLLPVIVKAIQEESTQKDNEIAALKAVLKSLEARLQSLEAIVNKK